MAKKNIKKTNKMVLDQNLPQNILPMGERVEANKNIYISQVAYKEIHGFTKNKTTNESGGMLIGTVIEEFGKTNIVISGFVEAKYTEATSTTLKFTHETWDYVHGEIEKKYENGQIVGWIHTHPDFGIFLSEYDTFIQENFFKEDYQVAYVVDPIQHIEGFYFWINGKIERCKGFYIFDKTGEKIDIEEEKEKRQNFPNLEEIRGTSGNQALTWLLGGELLVAIVVFAFISVNMMNRMRILENQQENLVESANKKISYLQQQISILNGDIADLKEQIDELKSEELNPDNEQTGDGVVTEKESDISESTEQTAVSDNEMNESTEDENEVLKEENNDKTTEDISE